MLLPLDLFLRQDIFGFFRALIVLNILRAVRAITELRIISNVLIKSVSSLSYTGIFFALFIYIYSVMGAIINKYQTINVGDKFIISDNDSFSLIITM